MLDTIQNKTVTAQSLKRDDLKVSNDQTQNGEELNIFTWSKAYQEMYLNGLWGLFGQKSVPDHKWDDAMTYARAIILSPQDSGERAKAYWSRSCSNLNKALLERYGQPIIDVAHSGSITLAKHFEGRVSIAHVDKKASFMRHCKEIEVASGFWPPSSPLAVGCYGAGALTCSFVLAAFLPPEKAVRAAALSHPAICDDYANFTEADYEVRIRMIALAVGTMFDFGPAVVGVFMDSTCLQGVGSSAELSPSAAMAWRAVQGCTTPYSEYNFGGCEIDAGLVAPEVMMAIHDILDWRSDAAAGYPENGIMAMYGLGHKAPFHIYLEAMLRRVLDEPRSGLHSIAAMVYLHFTMPRYAAWEYRGHYPAPCDTCLELTKDATAKAGLEWNPKIPPRTFSAGRHARELGRRWIEKFEDHGLVQEALGWFQHLLCTGEIWLFDVFTSTVNVVDGDTAWI
ncbi:hypothetical protein HIM_05435 [Hirsutella minnesotensis 3608]|uniref:Uncharacterized protein n=1 Tax=Hirsutella minnesotensis 3608 TaxID=1043627 RepID=A0A0F7ZKH2_9HYPO|nr:hypothetical protein HIM_05435 [Hirsutella minnesotensis 3608]